MVKLMGLVWICGMVLGACVSEIVPDSDSCQAWADAVTARAAECGLSPSAALRDMCKDRIVTNVSQLWNECIPEVQAATCDQVKAQAYCQPKGLKL